MPLCPLSTLQWHFFGHPRSPLGNDKSATKNLLNFWMKALCAFFKVMLLSRSACILFSSQILSSILLTTTASAMPIIFFSSLQTTTPTIVSHTDVSVNGHRKFINFCVQAHIHLGHLNSIVCHLASLLSFCRLFFFFCFMAIIGQKESQQFVNYWKRKLSLCYRQRQK